MTQPGGDRRGAPAPPAAAGASEELDLRGEVCPYTFLRAKLALEPMAPATLLRVIVDSAVSARDVPRSLAGAGHAVLEVAAAGPGVWVILVARSSG